MKSLPLFVTTFIGFLWLVAMATPAAATVTPAASDTWKTVIHNFRAAMATSAAAAPDLVPILSAPPNGTVGARNAGTTAAGPTLLLVHCVAGGGGRCPPIPPDQMAAYAHPSFPDQIVVRVPALQPRTRFDHHLTFWDRLCWPAGSYVISARADVGNSEAEGVNEGNNYVESTLVSQRSCAGVPRPPFDPSKPPLATPVVPSVPQPKPTSK